MTARAVIYAVTVGAIAAALLQLGVQVWIVALLVAASVLAGQVIRATDRTVRHAVDDLEQAMQPALNVPEADVWSGPALGYSAKDTICPVCGYYCLGTGGFDCIDKPGLVRAGEPA